MDDATARTTQTLVRAARVPDADAPYDTLHVTLTYPALDADPVDNVGTLAPDTTREPYPVVLWFPGMNVDPSYYRWLGETVAASGYLFVTFTNYGVIPPSTVGITPGADLSVATADAWGTGPIGRLIQPLLDVVSEVNHLDGPLHGLIDTGRVALGGHSAGGSIVLNSADHRYFPQVRAVFAYAAHTMASPIFGWPAGTVLPLSGDCPALVMSGTEDGLVAASARFYGEGEDRVDPIARTFDTLPDKPTATGSWFLSVKGANHFSITSPHDAGLPRRRDDFPSTADQSQIRDLIGRATVQFLHHHVRNESGAASALEVLLDQSPLAAARTR